MAVTKGDSGERTRGGNGERKESPLDLWNGCRWNSFLAQWPQKDFRFSSESWKEVKVIAASMLLHG